MTAQHTPGPWRQEDIEQDGNILITDEQGVTVATCWKQPLDPLEWVEGNANLIETAPDLRDALIVAFGAESFNYSIICLSARSAAQKRAGEWRNTSSFRSANTACDESRVVGQQRIGPSRSRFVFAFDGIWHAV